MATTKSQAIQDFEWAIGANCWSLKVCGILRDENYTLCRNVFSILLVPLYASIIFTFGLLPQILALFKVWGHLGLMIDNLIMSVPFTITLCEIITMWFKQEVIVIMINLIMEDWSKLQSQEERKVMIKYAQVSRIITFGAYASIATTTLVYQPPVLFGFVLRTVTNLTDTGDRALTLQSSYPIDVYQTPIYQLTVISQAVACSVTGFCYSTVGSLYSVIVLHVCSQLENLSINIECMVKDHHKNSKNFQRTLTSNVQEHQRLIRFATMVENTFNIMLLLIVISFMIMLCVQAFALVTELWQQVIGDNASMFQVIFCISFMIFIVFVMFVYSSVGEVLLKQSAEIQYAAYNCEWYNLEPTEAHQLKLILIRAQQPLTVTVGKFVPLTLSTFASMLKTTAGYLSCLLAVQN